VRRLLTPNIERVLVEQLVRGKDGVVAAAAAGISYRVLQDYIRKGTHGHPAYAAVAGAVVAGHEERRRQELALAQHATALLDGGASLRSAAKQLGVSYDELKVPLRRARAGDPALLELATAAHRRARAPRRPRTCPHCGAELAPARHRGEEAAA